MLTRKISEPDRDKAQPPRSGHGAASVMARLKQQAFNVDSSIIESDQAAETRESPVSASAEANDAAPDSPAPFLVQARPKFP